MALEFSITSLLAMFAAVYMAGYHFLHLAMILVAPLEILHQRRAIPETARRLVPRTDLLPGISVVIPAYNEQLSIVRTVRSVLDADYPDFEVIVVNDGSTDPTLGVLWRAFDLVPSNDQPEDAIPTQAPRAVFASRTDPRLRIVDKRNSGKADALNTGINWCTRELVCAIDADILLDRRALTELALPFVCDERIIATSGLIRLLNGCGIREDGTVTAGLPKTLLENIQLVEYLRTFNVARLSVNRLDAHLIISGALGLFRRSLLVEVGGYQVQAIGEDMELVVRLHRHLLSERRENRMVFAADALCFTEAPRSLRELGRQRTRWHLGLLTTLRLHRGMLLRPRYGSVGLVAFPYFLIFELFSPFIEIFGWVLLSAEAITGLFAWHRFIPFLVAVLVLPALISGASILVDAMAWDFLRGIGRRWKLLAAAFLEPFGYHQVMLVYRLRAFVRYYGSIHVRGGWRPPKRQGGLSVTRKGSSG